MLDRPPDAAPWPTRLPRRSAIVGIDSNWYDCEGNDDTWKDAGLTDYTRWYAQTRDRPKDERPELDAREIEKLMDKEVQPYQLGQQGDGGWQSHFT